MAKTNQFTLDDLEKKGFILDEKSGMYIPSNKPLNRKEDNTIHNLNVLKERSQVLSYRGANKKATDAELIQSYTELNSVWKVAEKFGMCGQSVQERLKKLGIEMNNRSLTVEEKLKIIDLYDKGFKRGDGLLKELSKQIDRTVPFICRYAKSMNLSNNKRQMTAENANMISKRTKEWIKLNGHPKGFEGHKHTVDALEKISKTSTLQNQNRSIETQREISMKMLKTRVENNGTTLTHNRTKTTWKQGWRTIGGIRKYYRSRWEANYARYLQFLKENNSINSWTHESKTFWFEGLKRGTMSYLPDFCIKNINGTEEYHEVKGWMDARSKTKIKRMKKYYPEVKLILIQAIWFKQNAKKLKLIIADWE